MVQMVGGRAPHKALNSNLSTGKGKKTKNKKNPEVKASTLRS
jgi:hypothetical protein